MTSDPVKRLVGPRGWWAQTQNGYDLSRHEPGDLQVEPVAHPITPGPTMESVLQKPKTAHLASSLILVTLGFWYFFFSLFCISLFPILGNLGIYKISCIAAISFNSSTNSFKSDSACSADTSNASVTRAFISCSDLSPSSSCQMNAPTSFKV